MRRCGKKLNLSIALAVCLPLVGCMVGPDFKSAPVQTTDNFKTPPTTQVSSASTEPPDWWKSFNDPVLDKLVDIAYNQNLPLQVAGQRVLQARAERGIAVGNFFPQLQQATGGFAHIGTSRNDANALGNRYFDATSASFDVEWELDVWGKFRRGIESANASLYSSVMNYDDVLVTLVADVATAYINIRGLDERIKLANENVKVQEDALNIANVRFKAGGTSQLDVEQAKVELANTQASVPVLIAQRDAAENQLCVLLGIAPADLSEILGKEEQPIPMPPDSIAVGIPTDLLRRRPDVRRAEADAAAQSAQIGVAVADLLPHFQLFGTIGYTAENPGDLFNASSLAYQVGPAFKWDILNYGRIINNVRVQDSLFEQLLTTYQNTVLTAQEEVANSITSLVHSREESQYLADSVAAAQRGMKIAMLQYRTGGADYVRVLIATQFLVTQEDDLTVARINTATSAIQLNKALGGGWEIREGHEFVPQETIQRMRKRTNWGNITDSNYGNKSDMLLFKRPPVPTTEPYKP